MSIPEVTLDAIHAAAADLGLILDDAERIAVLRHSETADIWACPGSGKTTILVAKLHLLAQRWSMPHRGICAISHTNVAKEEIVRRLSATEARRLLVPPHFVDTIQRFVHEFLAIPALAQKFGVRAQHIMSSEQLASEIQKNIQQPQYRPVREWLAHQANPETILADIRFSGSELDVEVPRLKDRNGSSYTALRDIKLALASRGMFTYRDMYSLGRWYVEMYPSVAEILAHRFPVVFFDESQDTDPEQWSLLGSIFSGRSVIQRFGDNNQAIYESLAAESIPCDFPNVGHLSMSRSLRFSRSIAHLVENLSLTPGITLTGDAERTDRAHAILEFTPESAHLVLPRFAKYVLEQFPERPDSFRAHAVGAIANPTGSGAFPSCIQHYYAEYEHRSNYGVQRPSCFAEYILLAQTEAQETGSASRGVTLLEAAISEVLRIENIRPEGYGRGSGTGLLEALRGANPEVWSRLTAALVELLSMYRAVDDRDVSREFKIIGPVIIEMLGRRPAASKPFFTQVPVAVSQLTRVVASKSRNRYQFESGDTAVEVNVGTIHSVKGQSHDATLVLETRYHTFDLERCKPFLLGERPKALGARDSAHLRRIYVGVTRPRELLVLAMQREHLTDDERNRLRERGWAFIDADD